MADKDASGMVEVFADLMDQVVVTQVASTSRGMPVEDLAEIARGAFGPDRVHVQPRLDDAIETAMRLAEQDPGANPGC